MASSILLGDPLVKELLICPLCSEFYDDPRVMPCQHTFCLRCLQQQFQTSHASSRVRVSTIRCPTCFTSAPIPIRGVSNFPIDHKVQKVKELVESVMMPGILRKSRVELLEGRPRSGSKSRPSSWTGDIDVLVASELAGLNKTFPTTKTEEVVVNSGPHTKEACTDTNDDNLENNLEQQNEASNNSNFEELGTQTDICDITKCIGYEKPGYVGENGDLGNTFDGRNKSRDHVPNGGSHIKRSCENTNINGAPHYKVRKQESSNGLQNNGIHNADEHVTEVLEEHYEYNNNKMDSDGVDFNCDTMSQDRGEPTEDANSEDTGSINEEALKRVFVDEPKLLWKLESDEFNMPTSVVMTSNGNTVVGEYGNCKLQFYESDGTYMQSVDQVKPFSLALDKEGNIVVGDRKDKTIKVYNSIGEIVYGWERDTFLWISGVGVTSQGNIVVFDREDCKIGIFTPEGERVHQFGHYGDRDSQLCMADFLTVDAHDRILVCDSGHHCVKVFDLNGTFLGMFGERGTSNRHLLWPKGVCVDGSDNILVSDQRNDRISLYNSDGRFIQTVLTTGPSPFNIGFQTPNKLAVTSFGLNGHSEINLYQI